jgi:hypothetical protein
MFRHSDLDGRPRPSPARQLDPRPITETLITLEPSEYEAHGPSATAVLVPASAAVSYPDSQSPSKHATHVQPSSSSAQSTSALPPLVKNAGSLSNAENVCDLHRAKPELKKSHTIDHSNPTTSTHGLSKTNQKVQKAMRKLELALRLSFNDNK